VPFHQSVAKQRNRYASAHFSQSVNQPMGPLLVHRLKSSVKPRSPAALSHREEPASLSKEWAIQNPIASPHLHCMCESPCGSRVNKSEPLS
uniref:Uncharacterized protein n=1 Tax=Ditylenchus dipsaci TaxID=166011 RepID=A0A915E6Z7_9BILA